LIYGRDVQESKGIVVLFGGPAGAGKTTLARAWRATHAQAAHVELDEIRHLIISDRADPQEPGELQAAQYRLSVEATCALARGFAEAGCDVAIDDVFEPDAFDRFWRRQLDGFRGSSLSSSRPSTRRSLGRRNARSRLGRSTRGHSTHGAPPGTRRYVSTRLVSTPISLALVLDRLR
jgi:chloramphenicol 3-O-phosphotransferase